MNETTAPVRWDLSYLAHPQPTSSPAAFTIACRRCLSRRIFGAWLDGSAGPELLKPANEDLLQAWPVSKRVNRPGNDEVGSLVDAIEVTSF
jgi:hypothetical protein